MEHGKSKRKFGRETKQRKELIRGLAEALIERGKITTTQAKAKSLRPFVEKLVTKARTDSVPTMRNLVATVGQKSARKLVKELGPKFAGRAGGYTRIISLPARVSDSSKMATIEFVE